jgi:molybdate transport system substrate-binding protein
MPTRRPLAVVAAVPAAVLTGCTAQPADPDGAVLVFAAASLTKTFTAIGEAFTAAHPATPVETSFAGSADLLAQLTGGARADVLATADAATMDKAEAAGLLDGPPASFATNTLTIAVAPGNPKGVRSFRDLNRVATVMCAPQVPCGAALPGIEIRTGTPVNPVSEESSVTDVLNKVIAGQADAGIVYITDARGAGERVQAVPFPEAATAVNSYRIAALAEAANPAAAAQFIDAVTGPRGREILAAAGFGAP